MNETTEQVPVGFVSSFSLKIDGHIYTAQAFFNKSNTQTMQQKIEHIIRRVLLAYNPVTD